MTIVCTHCGLPQEDHHDFVPQMPDGCICDPFSWFDDPAPVCAKYVGKDEDDACARCEHEKGCHK